MNRLPIPARGFKRLKPLIEYALKEGWEVTRTSGGHLCLTKPGLPAIYTGSTPSDHRSPRNALARLQREGRATARQGDHND
jgi:hypothetical protein